MKLKIYIRNIFIFLFLFLFIDSYAQEAEINENLENKNISDISSPARPNEVEPSLYCHTCKVIIEIMIGEDLYGSRKEYDIIESIDNICDKSRLAKYADPYIPRELKKACHHIKASWTDELMSFMLRR